VGSGTTPRARPPVANHTTAAKAELTNHVKSNTMTIHRGQTSGNDFFHSSYRVYTHATRQSPRSLHSLFLPIGPTTALNQTRKPATIKAADMVANTATCDEPGRKIRARMSNRPWTPERTHRQDTHNQKQAQAQHTPLRPPHSHITSAPFASEEFSHAGKKCQQPRMGLSPHALPQSPSKLSS
jgi:hypothetical protein